MFKLPCARIMCTLMKPIFMFINKITIKFTCSILTHRANIPVLSIIKANNKGSINQVIVQSNI